MVTGIGNFYDLSICIPFRGDNEGRRSKIAGWIIERYENAFPGAQVIISDSGDSESGEFNRSEARNNAAEQSVRKHLYFADADTLTYPDQIGRALKVMESDPAQWVVTQQSYYIATNETTDFILTQEPETDIDFRDLPMLDTLRNSISVAGGYLVTREQFDSVGGYDARFMGWGYEDTAFLMSMETLWDYALRIPDSYVMHLEHPALRFASPGIQRNEEIFAQYQHANGNRDAMLHLIGMTR